MSFWLLQGANSQLDRVIFDPIFGSAKPFRGFCLCDAHEEEPMTLRRSGLWTCWIGRGECIGRAGFLRFSVLVAVGPRCLCREMRSKEEDPKARVDAREMRENVMIYNLCCLFCKIMDLVWLPQVEISAVTWAVDVEMSCMTNVGGGGILLLAEGRFSTASWPVDDTLCCGGFEGAQRRCPVDL